MEIEEEENIDITIVIQENTIDGDFFEEEEEEDDVPENLILKDDLHSVRMRAKEDEITYTLYKPGIKAFNEEEGGFFDGDLCELYSSKGSAKRPDPSIAIWNADLSEDFCET